MGNITSNHSPALTAANGYLYLAYNDASNNNWLIRSSNGVDWSTRYQVAPGYSTTWAPAIAAGNTTYPNKLFVGFASASTFTPIICDVNANLTSFPSSTQNCASFPTLNQMNFNPALLAYNSGALMAYEYRGNAHCVYTYFLDPDANSYSIYQDGFANCPEQTSTAPSLAQYSENDRILLGFGSNDSSRHFDVRFTDQLSTYFNYRQSLPQEINGSPNLLVVHPTNYNPEFANFYIWNGQLRYMFGH